MSKRKRAERLIGKTIETEWQGPAKVLAVELHERFVYGGLALSLKLAFPSSRVWPDGRVTWEPVRSRTQRYTVIK